LSHDAALLDALSRRSVTTFSGDVFRATIPGYDPLTASTRGGRWSTHDGPSVLYTRLELIVVRSSDGQRFVFPIRRYEFADTTITVFWTRADKTAVSTTYTEFDAARQRMVQAATEDGPRREHYRC
jgi:hypothetical protein